MAEKYGFIYIWRDKKHKRYYVGCHWGHENDGYICSSNWMRNAYKRRPNDFKRRIIEKIYTNKKDLFLEEQRYLDMIKKEEIKTRYYNLNIIAWHWLMDEKKTLEVKNKRKKYRHSEETKKKLSESITKAFLVKYPIESRPLPPTTKKGTKEYKNLLSQKSKEMWDNRTDDELKEISHKISESQKGNSKLYLRGKPLSEEHRQKISAAQKGRLLTEEHKQKLRKPKKRKNCPVIVEQ